MNNDKSLTERKIDNSNDFESYTYSKQLTLEERITKLENELMMLRMEVEINKCRPCYPQYPYYPYNPIYPCWYNGTEDSICDNGTAIANTDPNTPVVQGFMVTY